MNKLESIFLKEPLEKPHNLPLRKPTAVPGALPTPNHRSEPPDHASGVQGTPASHYPPTRRAPRKSSRQNPSDPRQRRGTSPRPLSGAITRRQHPSCPLVVHHPGGSGRGRSLCSSGPGRPDLGCGGALRAGGPVGRGVPRGGGCPVGYKAPVGRSDWKGGGDAGRPRGAQCRGRRVETGTWRPMPTRDAGAGREALPCPVLPRRGPAGP